MVGVPVSVPVPGQPEGGGGGGGDVTARPTSREASAGALGRHALWAPREDRGGSGV